MGLVLKGALLVIRKTSIFLFVCDHFHTIKMPLPTNEEESEDAEQALEVIAVHILLHMLLRKASEEFSYIRFISGMCCMKLAACLPELDFVHHGHL